MTYARTAYATGAYAPGADSSSSPSSSVLNGTIPGPTASITGTAARPAYMSAVLADAPLAYYRFGDASGTTLTDSSGNGRDGTYATAPTRGSGLVGVSGDTSFDTSGGTNWATVLDAAWMYQSNVTFEAVIRPTSLANNPIIFDRDNENVGRRFQFRINSTSSSLELIFWTSTGGPFFCTSSTVLSVNTTYHVAATYDGTTARLYLNGTLDKSLAQSGGMSLGGGVNLDIGRHIYNGGISAAGAFVGLLDEVAYYGTALSQTRLAAHYTAATTSASVGSITGTLPSATGALAGTVTPPAITGTFAASLPSPSGSVAGTATSPTVTGAVAATLPTPTVSLTGTAAPPTALTGTLVGILPAFAVNLAGTVVDPSVNNNPDVLSGDGGSFTLDFEAAPSYTLTFIPDFAGSLVMQSTRPADWQASYTILDSDGDDVQDDTGTLGVIWDAEETMTITIAPVDGQPFVPVAFTWSYAARASSPLSISLDNDEVLETPGGLGIDIYNGQPGDTVALSVLGPTAVADFQTVHLDTFGVREDLMVRLPALNAGDYFLRVEGDTSGGEDTPFTVLDDALQGQVAPKVDDTAPPRDPAQHWRLFDLRDHSVNYTFVRNPSSWTNVYPPNDFTHDKTTAPDGQPLTWQAAARPWRMEFTGWLDTEAEYNDLLFWSQLRRRLWLIDHRNRAWLITIEQFDAQAQVKPNLPWAHKYTVKTLVFMQG